MKQKIVVAMSGGVDSSVAAALLKEQGYDVIGVTLKTRNWDDSEGKTFGGCCGSSDFYDARSVAQTIGIPHYNFDYVEQFRVSVIGYFKDSYVAGETPNPCIACNQFVKFDQLLRHAQALGAEYLATGHYARITEVAPSPLEGEGWDGGTVTTLNPPPRSSPSRGEEAKRYQLRKALDTTKDQSYVLYHLGQTQLSKLKFPVGEFTKVQIREIARKYQLVTADKPDSQEICFVPNNDYRQFLVDQVPASSRVPGTIRHKDGAVLGQHEGLPFYTIGQRSGLGLAVGRPLYVVDLDMSTNTLVVGEKDDVNAGTAFIRQVSWVSGEAPTLPARLSVKIRYKHTEAAAVLTTGSKDLRVQGSKLTAGSEDPRIEGSKAQTLRPLDPQIQVVFDVAQSAVTPGQAAVFYDGDQVVGGGVIDHVVR